MRTPQRGRGGAPVRAWHRRSQPDVGQLVLHTDPAYGIDVLAPAAARGAIRENADAYGLTAGAPGFDLAKVVARRGYRGSVGVILAERGSYCWLDATGLHHAEAPTLQGAGRRPGTGVVFRGAFALALAEGADPAAAARDRRLGYVTGAAE